MNPWSPGVPARSHGHLQTWTRKQAQWLDGVRNVRGTPDQKPSLTSSGSRQA